MRFIRPERILTKTILQAQNADEKELESLRRKILGMVSKIGAKYFVQRTAEVLKNNFQIEGCNDARIPLKRIFSVSLQELGRLLAAKKYQLSPEHPISQLSQDHKESIGRLKFLHSYLAQLEEDTPGEKVSEKLEDLRDYYSELDLHIRKEENVLFPVLTEYGMKEHPDNLVQEHKGLRDILSDITSILEISLSERSQSIQEAIEKFKHKFIPDICNHIFRETYIFYPAALSFITSPSKWEDMRGKFDSQEYKTQI